MADGKELFISGDDIFVGLSLELDRKQFLIMVAEPRGLNRTNQLIAVSLRETV